MKPCKNCGGLDRNKHGQCKPCKKDYHKTRRERDSLLIRSRKYGVSVEEIQAMLEDQQYACAICQIDITKIFRVDHDHLTDIVRELLCPSCNSGLGFFKDDKSLLEEAVQYLDKHKKTC